MTKIPKLKTIILLTIFILFFAMPVFAAELFFEARNQEFTQGEEFLASIFLNTEGESINAVEGRIVFPEELLEVKEIRDGNSIINFWIERPSSPKFQIQDSKFQIPFSGIIPGGYQEAKGFLFSIVFQAKANGNGAIEISDARVLLNDGEGTPTNTRILNLEFRILKSETQIPDSRFQIPSDIDPPEEFTPQIAADPAIFGGKWFLVFATQDKGSGIHHYEVLENRRQKIENRNWEIAESPHMLKDQKLKSYIYVKAVDRTGNERIAILPPTYPLKWYEVWWVWVIIILGLGIAYLVKRILWKKQVAKQTRNLTRN